MDKMTDRELINKIIDQDEKVSEALNLATEVIADLVDRVLKLEEKVYGSNK